MKISVRMLSCVAALLCAATPSFAQTTDDARIAELARNAARQFEAARAELPQTRPTTPITAPGPNVELTLDDATARALERNLDLAVERLNPMIQDANLERIQAAYRPRLAPTNTRGESPSLTPSIRGCSIPPRTVLAS